MFRESGESRFASPSFPYLLRSKLASVGLGRVLNGGEPVWVLVGWGLGSHWWARAERGRCDWGGWWWAERLSPASALALARITGDLSVLAGWGWRGKWTVLAMGVISRLGIVELYGGLHKPSRG